MAERILFIGLGAAMAIGLSGAGTALAAPSAALFAMRHHRYQPWYITWAPMVVSGVLSIYGLIIGILLAIPTLEISDNPPDDHYIPKDTGYRLFAAGLVVGLPCLVSGAGIGAFLHRFSMEDAPYHMMQGQGEEQPLMPSASSKQIIPAWALILNLAFMEAIGLYGLIIALFLAA